MRRIEIRFDLYKGVFIQRCVDLDKVGNSSNVSNRDVKLTDQLIFHKSLRNPQKYTDNLLIADWAKKVYNKIIKPESAAFIYYGAPFYIVGGTVQNFIASVGYKSFWFAYSSCEYDRNKKIGYEHEHRAAEKTCLLLNRYVREGIDITEKILKTTYNMMDSGYFE